MEPKTDKPPTFFFPMMQRVTFQRRENYSSTTPQLSVMKQRCDTTVKKSQFIADHRVNYRAFTVKAVVNE